MTRLQQAGFVLLNDQPKRGADNKLVCFVHPKSSHGVLIELCQEIPQMSPFEITYAIVGGFIAGCVNTLAGNGSVITLGF